MKIYIKITDSLIEMFSVICLIFLPILVFADANSTTSTSTITPHATSIEKPIDVDIEKRWNTLMKVAAKHCPDTEKYKGMYSANNLIKVLNIVKRQSILNRSQDRNVGDSNDKEAIR